MLPLYARPSDNVAPNATVTVTAGAENAEFPAAFLVDLRPDKPAKLTGTSGTYRFTFSGNQILEGVVIAGHNLAGAVVTLTCAAGVNQVIAIPANVGGQPVTAWIDLRESFTEAQRTDDIWDLAITGASAAIGIGEVLLLTNLRELDWIWGPTITPEYDTVQHRTFGRARILYDKRILVHRMRGQVNLEADYSDLRALHAEARGPVNVFVIIPDEDTNEAFLMAFTPTGFSWSPTDPGITQMPMELEQVSNGPPLFA